MVGRGRIAAWMRTTVILISEWEGGGTSPPTPTPKKKYKLKNNCFLDVSALMAGRGRIAALTRTTAILISVRMAPSVKTAWTLIAACVPEGTPERTFIFVIFLAILTSPGTFLLIEFQDTLWTSWSLKMFVASNLGQGQISHQHYLKSAKCQMNKTGEQPKTSGTGKTNLLNMSTSNLILFFLGTRFCEIAPVAPMYYPRSSVCQEHDCKNGGICYQPPGSAEYVCKCSPGKNN